MQPARRHPDRTRRRRGSSARAFDDFWGPLLKTNFEYSFFPGAAGQVGYEIYLYKRDEDGHNLLFGNMGSEMTMYALQKAALSLPRGLPVFLPAGRDDGDRLTR